MSCTLEFIARACKTSGGLSKVEIIPPGNVTSSTGGLSSQAQISIVDPAQVYVVHFRKGTGEYVSTMQDKRAGAMSVEKLSVYISKQQASREQLIDKLLNRRFHIRITDNNGFQRYLYNAQLTVSIKSGKLRSQFNGYIFTWTGMTDRHTPFTSIAAPPPPTAQGIGVMGIESDFTVT